MGVKYTQYLSDVAVLVPIQPTTVKKKLGASQLSPASQYFVFRLLVIDTNIFKILLTSIITLTQTSSPTNLSKILLTSISHAAALTVADTEEG
jgi:hypothetical protein